MLCIKDVLKQEKDVLEKKGGSFLEQKLKINLWICNAEMLLIHNQALIL